MLNDHNSHFSDFPLFETGQALQDAIAIANKSVLEVMLLAARGGDPLGPALLGVSDDALNQFHGMQLIDVMNVSKLGAPIFKLRFDDPAVLRTLLQTGFSSSSVISELTKGMPLPEIMRQPRRHG